LNVTEFSKGGFGRQLSPDQVRKYRNEWHEKIGRELENIQLSDDEIMVMKAMEETSYESRALFGLKRSTGLTKPTIQKLLTSLMTKGVVEQVINEINSLY